jgi:glutathione S-transferase kappa 1
MSAGAWGAPWIVAVNQKGETKSWFGNDRWDQVFDHLSVSYSPVTILPPSVASACSKL